MENTLTTISPTFQFLWRNGVLMQAVYVSDATTGAYIKTDWRNVQVGGKDIKDPTFKTFEQRNGRAPEAKRAGWDHVIEFDGGTNSNTPPKFGEGYGSYQIDGGEIVRVNHGPGHSCNSAEILTLVSGLHDLYRQDSRGTVLCRGDSKIAINWITCRKAPKKTGSAPFLAAISILHEWVAKFPKVNGEWRRRNHSVALFGH